MSGCDAKAEVMGVLYTEFAKQLPSDTVILTSGCAKYRYNKLNLGDIHGIREFLMQVSVRQLFMGVCCS
jgi:hydroxylamine reductase